MLIFFYRTKNGALPFSSPAGASSGALRSSTASRLAVQNLLGNLHPPTRLLGPLQVLSACGNTAQYQPSTFLSNFTPTVPAFCTFQRLFSEVTVCRFSLILISLMPRTGGQNISESNISQKEVHQKLHLLMAGCLGVSVAGDSCFERSSMLSPVAGAGGPGSPNFPSLWKDTHGLRALRPLREKNRQRTEGPNVSSADSNRPIMCISMSFSYLSSFFIR